MQCRGGGGNSNRSRLVPDLSLQVLGRREGVNTRRTRGLVGRKQASLPAPVGRPALVALRQVHWGGCTVRRTLLGRA